MPCIMFHDLKQKEDYIGKGCKEIWLECSKCDFVTPKRKLWTTGAMELIWQKIEELEIEVKRLNAVLESRK